MKFILFNVLASLFALSLSSQALASNLVVLGSAPNLNISSIDNLVKDYIELDQMKAGETMTRWLSVLSQTSTEEISLVVSDPSNWNYENIRPILNETVQHGNIVMAPVTPRDGFLCLQMKKQTKTLFVLPAGDGKNNLNIPGMGVKWCQAPNLLFVGGLGRNKKFWYNSNFGNDYVRVAALAQNLKVLNNQERNTVWSSTLASTAIVASEVLKFSKKYPRLHGYLLAHRFLEDRARRQKNLTSKVKGGRTVSIKGL